MYEYLLLCIYRFETINAQMMSQTGFEYRANNVYIFWYHSVFLQSETVGWKSEYMIKKMT